MRILENSVSVSEEVIDDHGVLLVTTSAICHFLAILLDQRENLSWNAFIVDVDLIFSLGFTHVLRWSVVGAGTGRHLLPLQKSTLIFAHELSFLFAKIKENASVGALSNSLVFLSFICCRSHHGIVVLKTSWKTWVRHFLGAT